MLKYYPPGPDIQMTDLGIAHEPFWQSNSFTKTQQAGIGIFFL